MEYSPAVKPLALIAASDIGPDFHSWGHCAAGPGYTTGSSHEWPTVLPWMSERHPATYTLFEPSKEPFDDPILFRRIWRDEFLLKR